MQVGNAANLRDADAWSGLASWRVSAYHPDVGRSNAGRVASNCLPDENDLRGDRISLRTGKLRSAG